MVTRSNEVIKKDVVDQLYWDYRIDAADIKVTVDDGKVTLKGSVPNYTAKSSASSDAWMVEGVNLVDNDLTVNFPETYEVPSDENIKNDVENSLLFNSDVDSTKIDIEVIAGIVTISGDLDAYWKKLIAESEAKSVSGVIDVVNKIAVVPTESIIDKDIAKDIVNSIDRNLNVSIDDVNIKVKDGVVSISGSVPNWNAYDAAMDAVRFTAGVIDIDDNLIIESM